jgi:UDP-N-acetylglucosamine acyltransferase
MTAQIHRTAVVSDDAKLGADVVVGPGAVIEGDVEIGAGSIIGAGSVVHRYTRMGERNQVGPHSVIGGAPQHTGYDGSETRVTIGDENVFREFTTVHRAYLPGAETKIGSNCLFMCNTHVGHDCVLGDHIVMTTSSILAGHVEVDSRCVFSANAGAHQFIRIGRFCMLGPFTQLKKDVPPFSLVDRYRALEQAFRALRKGDRELAGVPDTEDTRYLKEWLAEDNRFGLMPFTTRASRRKA